MPNVKLSREECHRRLLPRICVQCGARADVKKLRNFRWYPPVLNVMIPIGGLPFLILMRILTKTMRVEVPLCYAHQNHWIIRALIAVPFFLFCFIGGTALTAWGLQPDGPGPVGFAVGLTLLVALVPLIIVLHRKTIRPILITDDSITLALIHPEFIAVLKEERAQERLEEEEERERRRMQRARRRESEARELRPPPLPRRRRPE